MSIMGLGLGIDVHIYEDTEMEPHLSIREDTGDSHRYLMLITDYSDVVLHFNSREALERLVVKLTELKNIKGMTE